jgi:hypothetical protein
MAVLRLMSDIAAPFLGIKPLLTLIIALECDYCRLIVEYCVPIYPQ